MTDFRHIVGNKRIIKSMQSAVKNSKVSHAYIISGGEGCGKKLLASAFAKTLLCESGGEDACGECVSCRTFEDGNNPDVKFVRPTKTKALSVDDVREQIVSDISIKPYNHRHKIYIIPKADTLTVQAQNALLKTLEEPPEYAVLILLAENTAAFLETILSRCVTFKIRPLSDVMIKDYLMLREKMDERDAAVLAEYSQGSVGKALEFAHSEEFSSFRDDVRSITANISKMSLFELTAAAKELEKYRELADVTDMIYIWYRDVLVYKTTGSESLVIEKDMLPEITREAENSSFEALYNIPGLINDTKTRIKQNVNFVFALEMLFINIKEQLAETRA